MNLHEYQAKAMLSKKGIPIPNGSVCFDPLEAVVAARNLRTDKVVLKAQVHSGGRGKAGGVAVLSVNDDIRAEAARILGLRLVTNQTGPEGKPVSGLLVEEIVPVDREIYLGIVLDRTSGMVTIMASPEGGMDIETLAKEAPEKITTLRIHPLIGLAPFQARRVAYALTRSKETADQIAKIVNALYEIFVEYDCTLVEINPLVVSGTRVIALDSKVNIDDHALYRHRELEELRDRSQEDLMELSARKDGLSYIRLDGNIGCIVNGAGLAMATLDLIALHGGTPANFLDVGGGASENVVSDAMTILLDDNRVNAVFINIFGGILRCDILARGVTRAIQARGVSLPIVARIEGTSIEEGRRIFEQSGLPIDMMSSLDDAARVVVEKARFS
jgi:succinyl-CoA synthetase beta subunit